MSLMPCVLRLICALQRMFTLRSPQNDDSNLEESHLRELHWPACVQPAETWVHLRADTRGDKSVPSRRVIPEGFKSAWAHCIVEAYLLFRVIWTILPRLLSTLLFISSHLPRSLSMRQKSFQTPMRYGVFSHPSDSQALNGTCHASACPRTKDNCDLDKHWGEGREA